MKAATTVLVMTLILLLIPSNAEAQLPCGYFNGPCEGDGHDFVLSPENSCNAHTDCGWCLQGPCHPVCGSCPASDDATGLMLKVGLVALQEAASAGDLDQVLRLANGLHGYVAFNPARRSVQVRNCSADGIMANLPVRSEAQRLLALHLPTPGQMLASARAIVVGNQATSGLGRFAAVPSASPRQ